MIYNADTAEIHPPGAVRPDFSRSLHYTLTLGNRNMSIRVLHIITRIANGGAGENTLYSINGLDKGKYRIDLAIGAESEPGLLDRIGLDPAIRLIRVSGLRRDPSPLQELKAIRELRKIIRDGGYQIVHTHGAKAGILGRYAAHRERVPHIVSGIHAITFSDHMSAVTRPIYRFLEWWVGRFTDRFIAVGEDMRRKFIAAGVGNPEQYRVIHSGMDIARFRRAAEMSAAERRELRSSLSIPENATVVGKIARLEPRKGHHYLMEAAARIHREDPSVYFLIVGDGPETDRIKALAAELGISRNVVFAGYRTDVERFFSLSDVVVLASLWEGLPRVLVQAAVVGKPVVTFDVDGAWEIVEEGRNGYIVPIDDVPALSERIQLLTGDPDLRARMGAEARCMVDDSWSVEAMVASIDQVYSDLIDPGP